MTSSEIADIAAHKFAPRLKQMLIWKLKGIAKRVNNPLYIKIRKVLLKING